MFLGIDGKHQKVIEAYGRSKILCGRFRKVPKWKAWKGTVD
jgi:hypothetical protein